VSDVPTVRESIQAGSVLAASSALLLGAVTASHAVDLPASFDAVLATEEAVEPVPVAPVMPGVVDDLGTAAVKAKQIEVQQAKRAAARAQRSSGPMFTPTTNYKFSARFGQPGGWASGYHTGLDFAAPTGTPVFSALAGTVVESGWGGAYGNHLVIKHANGVKTLYAHLSSASVSKGDEVLRGQRIGAVGTTGNSTGPHLHFEVIKGDTQKDPAAFL